MHILSHGVETMRFIASPGHWPAVDPKSGEPSTEDMSGRVLEAFRKARVEEVAELDLVRAQIKAGEAPQLQPARPQQEAIRRGAWEEYTQVMEDATRHAPLSAVFPKALLEKIDDLYTQIVHPNLKVFAVVDDPVWQRTMQKYQEQLFELCVAHWDEAAKKARVMSSDEQTIATLKNAHHKLAWNFELQRSQAAFPLPLPTKSFIHDLQAMLDGANIGIMTVSAPTHSLQ